MKIKTKDSEANAHLALPKSGQGHGVLVLHPWWGLNEDIKAVCDQLAAAGFAALAPDLYDGRIATTIPEAEKYSEAMDEESAKSIVQAAAEALQVHEACQTGPIGVIGFSLGAMFAIWLAHAQPAQVSAVVLFYGLGWANQTNTQASYLGHFAENDPYDEDDYRDEFERTLRANGRPTTFHIYPNTGHWFFEPSRTDAYDAAAAELAWERTLSFLKETLT
ncbi:dienelactone hydrolase family protein [Candidatus Leptofilum sp.]|uniref:dienelactone hydrolase family protein n=1 Tax=Candidatus Leptofilum sp. TaxID=3241576 RepID=UPI003B5BCF75